MWIAIFIHVLIVSVFTFACVKIDYGNIFSCGQMNVYTIRWMRIHWTENQCVFCLWMCLIDGHCAANIASDSMRTMESLCEYQRKLFLIFDITVGNKFGMLIPMNESFFRVSVNVLKLAGNWTLHTQHMILVDKYVSKINKSISRNRIFQSVTRFNVGNVKQIIIL